MDEIQYNDRLVAFIDILGFSQMINDSIDENLRYIGLLNGSIHKVLRIIQRNKNSFTIKVFSDCICISCNNTLNSFTALIKELSYLQFIFSYNDIFFIRGGLTHGLHFESENIIFSKGLVKAYELEKKAIYPRIIIDSTIIESLKYYDSAYVMKAPDGYYFIDYLDLIKKTSWIDDIFEVMTKHKMAIIKQVKTNLANNTILDKYRWLTEYHNLKINDLFSDFDNNNIDFQAMKNELFINVTEIFPKFEKQHWCQ